MIMTIVMAIGVVLVLLFFFKFVSSSSNTDFHENLIEVVDWDAIADAELQSYLPNQKINAIKRYRELTNVGLKDAKDAIEYALAHPSDKKKSYSPNSSFSENLGMVDWDAIADAELQSYLPDNKINAIKRYRELTDVGLKEAKDAVEYAIAFPDGRKKSQSLSKMVDTDAAGVRDLIAEGRIKEAIDLYASFMGIDEYSARDAIEAIQRDMSLGDDDDNLYGSSSKG